MSAEPVTVYVDFGLPEPERRFLHPDTCRARRIRQGQHLSLQEYRTARTHDSTLTARTSRSAPPVEARRPWRRLSRLLVALSAATSVGVAIIAIRLFMS